MKILPAENIKFLQKGFTLIELIIVIAIIGILAAAVLAAIDPVDKIRAGNDSKVQTDVRAIYDAAMRQSTSGTLPASRADITEIKVVPKDPSGNDYGYYPNTGQDDVTVCGPIKSKSSLKKVGASATDGFFVIYAGQSCYKATCASNATTCP